MPEFAAVTWKVKPGFAEQITNLFQNYRRPDSFVVRNAQGETVGKVLATAVFMKDTTIVRVIQFEGKLEDVLRHMGRQQGVRELEDAVEQYLEIPRDTSSPQGFREFFLNSSMRCLVQRFADVEPITVG